MFSYLLLIVALVLGVRALGVWLGSYERWRGRQRDYERFEKIIASHPAQAGSWAELAQLHYEDGEIDEAIEKWRTAIRAMPHGPFTETWKRKLKRALSEKEALERGERVDLGAERACDHCQKLIGARVKTCPHCNGVNYMSPLEFLSQPEVARSWFKETLAISLVCLIAAIIFSQLSLQWKGTVIISALLVCAYLFLRMMGNDIGTSA